MNRWRADLAAVGAGAVAGTVVLGVGGRAAMAAIAMVSGTPRAFSWMGSLEVVTLGVLNGIAGGVILALARRRWQRRGVLLGAAVGVVSCAIAFALSPTGRALAMSAEGGPALVICLSLLLFVAFGVLSDGLASRWSPGAVATPPQAPATPT